MNADESAAVKLSLTDRLSGLATAQDFFIACSSWLPMRRNRDTMLHCSNLDLDGFKEVNDAYGHATGDLLIRCVSQG